MPIEVINQFGSESPTLIVEPGISIIGNSMEFAVKVRSIKEMHNKRFVQLNTDINVNNPTRSSII